MPHFDSLKIYSCGKHCEKRRNCLKQAISPILTMLSTLFSTYFPIQMHLKVSSAICFNLDQSKILSSGNGLTENKILATSKLKAFSDNNANMAQMVQGFFAKGENTEYQCFLSQGHSKSTLSSKGSIRQSPDYNSLSNESD